MLAPTGWLQPVRGGNTSLLTTSPRLVTKAEAAQLRLPCISAETGFTTPFCVGGTGVWGGKRGESMRRGRMRDGGAASESFPDYKVMLFASRSR